MKRIVIPLVILLPGCDPTPPPQSETAHTPNPVFETQIQAMEKARAVEGQMMDAAEAQRKKMEDATQ